MDAKATYFTQEVTNRASTTGAQGMMGYLYRMPRNVAINDMRNYQMENPGTPDEFAVITYTDFGGILTGKLYTMKIVSEEINFGLCKLIMNLRIGLKVLFVWVLM